MPFDLSVRVLRIKLWDKGHTFDEIDNLSLLDLTDILSYHQEMSKVAEIERERKPSKKSRR